jgi:hypothetical protein
LVSCGPIFYATRGWLISETHDAFLVAFHRDGNVGDQYGVKSAVGRNGYRRVCDGA